MSASSTGSSQNSTWSNSPRKRFAPLQPAAQIEYLFGGKSRQPETRLRGCHRHRHKPNRRRSDRRRTTVRLRAIARRANVTPVSNVDPPIDTMIRSFASMPMLHSPVASAASGRPMMNSNWPESVSRFTRANAANVSFVARPAPAAIRRRRNTHSRSPCSSRSRRLAA